jgi:predicted acetyltransferase
MPELRGVDESSYLDWVNNLDLTFAFDYNPEEDTLRTLLDMGRTFGHWDDQRFVSTISAFPLQMTVPGNVVPCGGTTVVTVAPTHRRQGLLNEMMERHFEDIREHDEPIAALWASESEIYGRYGFGAASLTAQVRVNRPYPPFAPHVAEPAPVRLVNEEEARVLVPPFHDEFRVSQPGMFARWEQWWNGRVFNDIPSRRNGYTANRWVVVDGGGGIGGYARYRVKGSFGDDGYGDGEVAIFELFAEAPEAWAGLWSYLLSQDLMTSFVARLRSPDDPIFDLLAGPRRARPVVSDGVWVRIMDVVAALEARAYSADFQGNVRVIDPMGMTDGTFHLDLSTDGARVKRVESDPDITLDVRDLGAVYLGRPGLARMSRTGRVEGDPDVLRKADLAFSWDPQPWCPEIF